MTKKEYILKAARKIFVESGFAGASIGKIAKLAEVNNSLIFHHFESKAKLWQEVKKNIYEENIINSKILPDTNLSFDQFLYELLHRSIDFYRDNPDIIRMINWQRLEHNSSLDIGVSFSGDFEEWASCFKHYQRNGELNSEFKIEYIIKMILAVAYSAALDNSLNDPAYNGEDYIDFTTKALQKAFIQ